MDHLWLTREYDGRRIDTATPENSLLLLKPLGKAPHEGGKLMSEGSREYRLLLDWIEAGAPGPQKDEPDVKRRLRRAGRAHARARAGRSN